MKTQMKDSQDVEGSGKIRYNSEECMILRGLTIDGKDRGEDELVLGKVGEVWLEF